MTSCAGGDTSPTAPSSRADVDPEVWAVVDAAMQLRFVARCEKAAQFLVDLGHVAERVQFPVDALESSGGLGVRLPPMSASRPRVRAAWPEVAVPTT